MELGLTGRELDDTDDALAVYGVASPLGVEVVEAATVRAVCMLDRVEARDREVRRAEDVAAGPGSVAELKDDGFEVSEPQNNRRSRRRVTCVTNYGEKIQPCPTTARLRLLLRDDLLCYTLNGGSVYSIRVHDIRSG